MEKQKTAVEWLIEQMRLRKEQGLTISFYDLEMFADEAKQMEKEQMKEIMWDLTDIDMTRTNKGLIIDNMFKQYYNETYGNTEETKEG